MITRPYIVHTSYPQSANLSPSISVLPSSLPTNRVYIEKVSVPVPKKTSSNIPLKVANIVNAPLKLTNKAIGKIGEEIGTIGGAITGGTTGSAIGMMVSGSMTGLLGGGIGLALGGAIPATLLGGLGLFIGGGSGGMTGGIKGFNKGATLGKNIGKNVARFPLDVMQKGIETIAHIGIGTPLYLYDKVKSYSPH